MLSKSVLSHIGPADMPVSGPAGCRVNSGSHGLSVTSDWMPLVPPRYRAVD